MRQTLHIIATSCPGCGANLSATSSIGSNAMPAPGDFTVCWYCAMMLRYGESHQLRRATTDDLAYLAEKDIDAWQLFARVRDSIRRRLAKTN